MAEKKAVKGTGAKALENKKTSSPSTLPATKKGNGFFKIMIVLLVLAMLVGVGFAAGVYFKFFDLNKLAADLKLHQLPVIGQYFPKSNPIEEANLSVAADVPTPPAVQAEPNVSLPVQPSQALKQPAIADVEKERLEKLRQQEETKRISKLARLYGSMKPEEAVPILNQLDDDIVLLILNKMEDEQVAKLLAAMDNKRAAKLSQFMLKGKQL